VAHQALVKRGKIRSFIYFINLIMNMKIFSLTILGCSILFTAIAQNKIVNDPNAEVRTVKEFHAIRVSNGIHLYLTQGNEEAVAVSASERKFRDRIVTQVEDGVLKIYIETNHWNFWEEDWKNLRAYVSCKVLDELKASSGARVDVDGSLHSGILAMHFSSGSGFDGNVEVTDLKINQGSGADTKISGKAANLEVESHSGSSLSGYDLETDQCNAICSSGGSVRITVKKELRASASSGGQIYYKGSGVIKDISTSSGGEISRR
jgi:hypothetical protein